MSPVPHSPVSSGAPPQTRPAPAHDFDLFTASTGAEVEECFRRGDNINAVERLDRSLTTPLLAAISRKNTEVIRMLLKLGADCTLTGRKSDPKPIQEAAEMGSVEIIKILVESGASVNEGSKDDSALVRAAIQGHSEVVELLLCLGADVEGKHHHSTALIAASERGDLEMVELLLAAGASHKPSRRTDKHTAFFVACENGHISVLDRLAAAGADVNHKDRRGVTSLMEACVANRTDVARRLLALGAKIDLQDNVGWSALMWACSENHIAPVVLLLEHGAKTLLTSKRYADASSLCNSKIICNLLEGLAIFFLFFFFFDHKLTTSMI